MFGQKGQEAAPFELLVAVIIMAFVLLAGVNVMKILEEEECKGQLDSQMETIKSAIENVASGAGQRDFSFSLPKCFERGNDQSGKPMSTLQVRTENSRQICSAWCPGARIQCKLLWFSTTDTFNVKCLRISTVTNFPSDTAICNDFESSSNPPIPTDIENDVIEDGQYTIVRKFDLSSQIADVCAYKKAI